MNTEKPRRNTIQRRIILEELRSLRSHPTAAELYELTRQRLPRISLGTVYRNLEVLSQMGEIQKIVVSGTETRFDGDVSKHGHVRCISCGEVSDIRGLPSDLLSEEVEKHTSYKIMGYRLEFFGNCPVCVGESAS